MTLVNYALDMRGFAAIIGTDLLSLPAALVLKGIFKAPLLFDAHEYWPESSPKLLEFEKQFWQDMEKRLVAYTEYRQTVSYGLARLMSEQYGMHFECVPNCAPANQILPFTSRPARPKGECHFLYQGGFSVHRGIDLLIKAWPKTDSRAILLLRGPDNEYKDAMQVLARQTGLLGSRILFPKAVTESELINTAAEADVGLFPMPRSVKLTKIAARTKRRNIWRRDCQFWRIAPRLSKASSSKPVAGRSSILITRKRLPPRLQVWSTTRHCAKR